ncbi:efflux transporter outer membrane subunit [Swaminathania salitolerans]|uniref:RND transporter n=1 Tax=Swaminathania salitolerans TaxID=182838 RepID=A0A511BRR8_9PROT|nr:efflux transporter outer membrane subunit [Swaminathania salitolerans]GBQ14405.1 secretion system type I outer membrane efflux pump lipoprotein NodT [Swaminathania salitolerans LMG 21291]GEL03026.1 RND transporter [Swaminathania salitolerans]
MLLAATLLSGCDLAPRYEAPHFIYPDGWSGKGVLVDGKPADAVPKGKWWKVFNDPTLDALEEKMLASNPDLQAQAEAFTQSRDIARETEAQLAPQLNGSAGMSNNKTSRTRLWRGTSTNAPVTESSVFYSGAATWEPDFFSRIRNTTRMQKNLAQASAADYANLRLLLEAELASNYLGLRGLDAQYVVYDDSIRYYRTAVKITRLRQAGAIAAGLDVSRAENQLFATMAAQSNVRAQRQVLEHAIAVLVNTVPGSFHIAPTDHQVLPYATLRVPAGLPSQLLERRPDIASAERDLAANSRAIGVARAAFYPDVTFSLNGGFMNNGFDLASLGNSLWSYGVQAVEPLFTGGLRRAALQRAWAQYRESADRYRATILSAFQDVEDGLSQTSAFSDQQKQQAAAVDAALRTQRMTMALYTGGLTNYLDVVVAQQAALVARIDAVQAQTIQLQATVRLIRALGGGWDRSALPSVKAINPFGILQYDGLHHPRPAGDVDTRTRPGDLDLGGDNAAESGTKGLTVPARER